MKRLALAIMVMLCLAAPGAVRAQPVPSLEPAATQREWSQLVGRPAQTSAATPDCRPLRAVFYAASDWLRLATKLAANASPCAEYYISIPPLAADKTAFRTDQAWRIRALGSSFHALAEVHAVGWRGWVTANNSTWYEAGVEARRRMAAAGFDVSLGDGWVVNEFSSAVRRGLDVARAEMRDFVRGLHDGDGGPPTQGGVFDIGIGQGGSGPGAADLPTYKAQLEAWLQDGAFWSDMSRYVSDWSQELYGDPLNYAVSGAPLAARRDFLNDYFQHQLVGARLGGDATAAARSFLEDAYSPLANAAWQWDSGFPSTVIPFEQMQDYVSAQIYALRHFSASDGQARDHWGFAWAPHNASGMPPADFTAETGALLDRLAAAIHDSAEPLDPSDPGVGACGPPGENLWCSLGLPSAWFNDGWKTFTYWGRLTLAFATPAQDLTAGNASAPIAIQTRLRGSAYDTPNALVVRLDSSSAQGAFSTSASGPWASTIDVTIPPGGDTAPSVYYRDTTAGSPVLTASAAGTDSGEQTETVDPGAVAPPPPPAPPPTPPPPPPVLPPNQQPTITSTRFGELRHVLRGRPYVIESVRFRVCDDSNGRLLARVQQTLRRENRLLTKSIVARSLTGPGGGCRAYLISWQLRGAFLARGTYTVSLRVRDSQGAWSKPVQRSRHRAGSR